MVVGSGGNDTGDGDDCAFHLTMTRGSIWG